MTYQKRYVVDSDNDSHHSDASSSHSMSRYGSESPLYAIIMAETKVLKDWMAFYTVGSD